MGESIEIIGFETETCVVLFRKQFRNYFWGSKTYRISKQLLFAILENAEKIRWVINEEAHRSVFSEYFAKVGGTEKVVVRLMMEDLRNKGELFFIIEELELSHCKIKFYKERHISYNFLFYILKIFGRTKISLEGTKPIVFVSHERKAENTKFLVDWNNFRKKKEKR